MSFNRRPILMCGICGFVSPVNISESDLQKTIDEMTNLLSHRGPDDFGTYFVRGGNSFLNGIKVQAVSDNTKIVALGHRRLSIIDLSRAGRQPMMNTDRRFCITYNGELYNFKEIRSELESKGHCFDSNTDTEVVLKAYEEWGSDCVVRFNGMFAFAIFDHVDKSLFLARDRLGIKPLYLSRSSNTIAFSSEVKSLIELPWIDAAPNWDALNSHLLFGWCPEPLTMFDGIEKLPAGHWLKWKDGESKLVSFWEPAGIEEKTDLSIRDGVDVIDDLLDQSIDKQLISDVPSGVFLSGGLDSSLITACASEKLSEAVNTYTIAFNNEDKAFEAMPDDQGFARQVANITGSKHKEILVEANQTQYLPKILWHLEEPIADPAAINTYLICKAAKEEGMGVMLSGMGADEVFAGYRKHLSLSLAIKYQRMLPKFAREGFIEKIIQQMPVAGSKSGFRLLRWIKRFAKNASLPAFDCMIGNYSYYNYDELQSLLVKDLGTWENLYPVRRHKRVYDLLNHRDDISKATTMDTMLFLPSLNLAYTDKASMAAGVEVRVPLLDHHIVDFGLSLPSRLRLKGIDSKHVLKKVALKHLPKNIVQRPKAPFGAPLRSWMRKSLAATVARVFSEPAVKNRGLYNFGEIQKMVEANASGTEDYGHRLWGLLTIELWFQMFVDGSLKPDDLVDID